MSTWALARQDVSLRAIPDSAPAFDWSDASCYDVSMECGRSRMPYSRTTRGDVSQSATSLSCFIRNVCWTFSSCCLPSSSNGTWSLLNS